MAVKPIGVGIIGSGRIGRLRANLIAQSPEVKFLALSDVDAERVELIAEEVGADFHSTDNEEVLAHPDVDAVVVSTPEHLHVEPICRALELGKPVLSEKPLALSLADADTILSTLERTQGDLRVGYTQRFRRRFLNAKEQITLGRLGQPLTARLSRYSPRHMAEQIYKRSPHASPVTDSLTYMVDIGLWFFEGRKPVRVYAAGVNKIHAGHPSGAGDGAWALVTLEDGSTLNLGCSWILPTNWPAPTTTMGMEILGTTGAIAIDDSHRETIMATMSGDAVPSPYAPNVSSDVVFFESMPAGDWLLGEFWGPMREEVRAFLEHVTTGRDTPLTMPSAARTTLEVTLAIEKSAQTGQPIDLPLPVAD